VRSGGVTVEPGNSCTNAARLLTPYKRPSEIIIVHALPATAAGKILKHGLGDAARDRVIERV
jgi:long-chain acyl-CoA synthetase